MLVGKAASATLPAADRARLAGQLLRRGELIGVTTRCACRAVDRLGRRHRAARLLRAAESDDQRRSAAVHAVAQDAHRERSCWKKLARAPPRACCSYALEGAPPETLAESSQQLAAALRTDPQFGLVSNGAASLDAIPERLLPVSISAVLDTGSPRARCSVSARAARRARSRICPRPRQACSSR